MTSRPALFAACVCFVLGACDLNYDETREVESKPVPADLTIRQTPANPVRAGTLVKLTAVYADSLKPGYQVSWSPAGAQRKEGRTIEWIAPATPGEYPQGVLIFAPNNGSASLLVYTVVVP